MVGAAGSGKSTTLAAMINYRNENFIGPHRHHRGPDRVPAHQQDVDRQPARGGTGYQAAARARAVVRAAPDVILIGEIRDQDGMEAAINLAGTGHLVHRHACTPTTSAESLDRIINMFPRDQHSQVFLAICRSTRAQTSRFPADSVRTRDGKRVAAMEVMLNTPCHISELIKKGDVVGVKEAVRNTTGARHAQLRRFPLRAFKAGKDRARSRRSSTPTPAHQPRSGRSTSAEAPVPGRR